MASSFFLVRHDVMSSLRRSRSQIHADFESIVSALRKSPGLLLTESNLKAACIFISGYDAALRGVPLLGFYHWLIVKADTDKDRRHWIQSLQRLARREAGGSASPESVLEAGCRILERFLAYRRRYGVRNVIAESMNMRGRQIAKEVRREPSLVGRVRSSRLSPNKSLKRTRAALSGTVDAFMRAAN